MSLVEQVFLPIREELIKEQLERQKLIKACRDLTGYSKRLIFGFHRLEIDAEKSFDISNSNGLNKTILDNWSKICYHVFEVATICENLSDLELYHKTIGNCLEEFVEAVTFGNYLINQKIVNLNETKSILSQIITNYVSEDQSSKQEYDIYLKKTFSFAFTERNKTSACIDDLMIPMSNETFILGIMDFTGEVMKYCIAQFGKYEQGKQIQKCSKCLTDLKNIEVFINETIEEDDNINGQIIKKSQTLRDSIEKITLNLLKSFLRDK